MNTSHEHLVRCSKCGAKNRMSHEKMKGSAKCGKCGTPLEIDPTLPLDLFFSVYGMRDPKQNSCGENRCRCQMWQMRAMLETEELFVPQPLMLSESDFDRRVLKSPLPALVFAWAPWCPSCRSAMPIIDDFAKDSKGKIRVGKLNVDSNPTLSSKYNILSVPQLLVFDNGRLTETMPGSIQKHELLMKMARYL